MDIRRGIIRAFDSGTYLADVQIVGSVATMLSGVPVAKQIGADLLMSGTKCGVLFFDETNPSDACVVFVYDGVPAAWITIFMPASAFYDVMGSPSRGSLGPYTRQSMSTWLFDDSLWEGVGSQLVVPTTGNIDIKYYYAMESATSGDVLLGLGHHAIADGEDANGEGSYSGLLSAVPGRAKYLKVETLVSSYAVTAGDLLRLTAARRGQHTDDTATGDLHFLGLEIKYV